MVWGLSADYSKTTWAWPQIIYHFIERRLIEHHSTSIPGIWHLKWVKWSLVNHKSTNSIISKPNVSLLGSPNKKGNNFFFCDNCAVASDKKYTNQNYAKQTFFFLNALVITPKQFPGFRIIKFAQTTNFLLNQKNGFLRAVLEYRFIVFWVYVSSEFISASQ